MIPGLELAWKLFCAAEFISLARKLLIFDSVYKIGSIVTLSIIFVRWQTGRESLQGKLSFVLVTKPQ